MNMNGEFKLFENFHEIFTKPKAVGIKQSFKFYNLNFLLYDN